MSLLESTKKRFKIIIDYLLHKISSNYLLLFENEIQMTMYLEELIIFHSKYNVFRLY